MNYTKKYNKSTAKTLKGEIIKPTFEPTQGNNSKEEGRPVLLYHILIIKLILLNNITRAYLQENHLSSKTNLTTKTRGIKE